RLADLVARRLLEDVVERRLGPRLARGEERDLVTRVDEAVGQQPDDPLDAPVAGGRHGEPGRREDGDPHPAASMPTRPSSTSTSQWPSKALMPESRIPSAHAGSSGASLSSACRSLSG